METLVRNDPEKIPFCRCCCCLPRLLLFLYLVVEERREEAEVVCADERFSNFYDDLRVSGRRISLRIFHVAINPILPLYRRPVPSNYGHFLFLQCFPRLERKKGRRRADR